MSQGQSPAKLQPSSRILAGSRYRQLNAARHRRADAVELAAPAYEHPVV